MPYEFWGSIKIKSDMVSEDDAYVFTSIWSFRITIIELNTSILHTSSKNLIPDDLMLFKVYVDRVTQFD